MRIAAPGFSCRFMSHVHKEEQILSGQRDVDGLLCELLLSTGVNSHETCTQTAESLLWEIQEKNITANGTPLSVAQPGENEREEVIDDMRALTEFPAAHTGCSVINRLVFLSKHRAGSEETLTETGEGPRAQRLGQVLPPKPCCLRSTLAGNHSAEKNLPSCETQRKITL